MRKGFEIMRSNRNENTAADGIKTTGLTFKPSICKCVCDACNFEMDLACAAFRFCPGCGRKIIGGIKNGAKGGKGSQD